MGDVELSYCLQRCHRDFKPLRSWKSLDVSALGGHFSDNMLLSAGRLGCSVSGLTGPSARRKFLRDSANKIIACSRGGLLVELFLVDGHVFNSKHLTAN